MGRTVRRPAALLRYGLLCQTASKGTLKPTQKSTRRQLLNKSTRPVARIAEEERGEEIPLLITDTGCDSDDEPGFLVPVPDMPVPDNPVNDSNLPQQDGRDEVQRVPLTNYTTLLSQ